MNGERGQQAARRFLAKTRDIIVDKDVAGLPRLVTVHAVTGALVQVLEGVGATASAEWFPSVAPEVQVGERGYLMPVRGGGYFFIRPGTAGHIDIHQATIRRPDNGVLQAGDYAEFQVPRACILERMDAYTPIANGSIATDVFKTTYATYPTLTAMSDPGNGPTIISFPSSVQGASVTAFTNWTTRELAAFELCRIVVTGTPTAITELTIHATVRSI